MGKIEKKIEVRFRVFCNVFRRHRLLFDVPVTFLDVCKEVDYFIPDDCTLPFPLYKKHIVHPIKEDKFS